MADSLAFGLMKRDSRKCKFRLGVVGGGGGGGNVSNTADDAGEDTQQYTYVFSMPYTRSPFTRPSRS